MNSLSSQEAFNKVNGEGKLSHKATTGTALHFSSDLMSLEISCSQGPEEQISQHEPLTAQLLRAALLDIIKRCSQDFQSC